MRLLLDANLSPTLIEPLAAAGYEVAHVGDLELLTASDDDILAKAAENDYVIVTVDSDFPMLPATRRASHPSVVLLRHVSHLRRRHHLDLLLTNLPTISNDLDHGAIASLSPTRWRCATFPSANSSQVGGRNSLKEQRCVTSGGVTQLGSDAIATCSWLDAASWNRSGLHNQAEFSTYRAGVGVPATGRHRVPAFSRCRVA